MFSLFCSFCWRAANGARYWIDSAADSKFWLSRTVPFSAARMHLRDLGLLGSIAEMGCELSKVAEREYTYFDESYRVEYAPGYRPPYVSLWFSTHTYPTGAGRELMRIVRAGKLVGYAEAVMVELTTQFPEHPLQFKRVSG